MSAPPPFYLLLKEVEAGVEEVGEGRMVGKEGIVGGGGKSQGVGGGGVERKEDGKIGLQAIVFNFSYVMEVFMRRGGRTLYTLKCHDDGKAWTQVH